MDHLEHPIPTPSNYCIYREPPTLRKVDEAAYTPTKVSIGPYHHGNKRLKSMEQVKLGLLYKFLKRTQDKSFDDYVHVLRDQDKIRRCYSETIPMESDEFFTFQYFEQHHLPRSSDGTPQVHHFCDMLRIFYVGLDQQLPREHNLSIIKPVYSASKLHDAGTKFEVNEDEIRFLKLKYSKGVLKIPRIMVSEATEIQLRNVVAFEQCHFKFPSSRSMTEYTYSCWKILLEQKKMLKFLLKRELYSTSWERIMHVVASITKRLGRYKAIFMQQYWSTPWRIASFLGAIMLLLLALIQTISSVIALFQN